MRPRDGLSALAENPKTIIMAIGTGGTGIRMLSIESVSVSLGGYRILTDLSLAIPRGSVAAVIGPNGSGKTTLFRTVAGLLKPDSGAVTLGGVRCGGDSVEWHGRVSFVPSGEDDLFPELTVLEHFLLTADLFELDREDADTRTRTLISLFSLERYRYYAAGTLSTGLSKRLSIALSVFRGAELYLYDEPFNGLDIESVTIFLGLIRTLKAAGAIVLVSSHFTPLLPDFADAVLDLETGRYRRTPETVSGQDRQAPGAPRGMPALELPWLVGKE